MRKIGRFVGYFVGRFIGVGSDEGGKGEPAELATFDSTFITFDSDLYTFDQEGV